VRQAANPSFHPFDVVSYEVNTKLVAEDETVTTANVVLRVNGNVHSATATGQGPVNALDVCLRQCLSARYPAISDIRLVDYKVRVLVEWSDHEHSWTTVGISDNVIAASWYALVDALRLELIRLQGKDEQRDALVEDYSWGV
jgi:2-isopropylmalate synthase